MDFDNYNDIGLFKFGIIAPAINHTHEYSSNEQFFDAIKDKTYTFNGKEYQFSKYTLKRWYYMYKKEGFNKLEKSKRKDKNKSRKLNNDTIQRIITIRENYPKCTGTAIYNKLIDENYINKEEVSLATVLRYIKKNNLKSNQVSNIERRMFEMEFVNDCWQSDTSDGPYITIDGEKRRAKLIMFIDDKSRMITGYDFFFNDNAINMQKVLKKAVKKYGIPKKLFVDNGGPYSNKQLSLICASLGIILINAKPYSPESKAKIERSFRTIKDGWMRCTDWNSFKSLEDAKDSLTNFLYNNYINKKHSSTNETPNERWHNEYKLVKYKEEEIIEKMFLHRINRKVRKDMTVKIENEYYEVPYKYVGLTIEIRYDPTILENVYIFEDEEQKETCKKVDKVSNSKVKRTNGIDYSKILNDERNVIEEGDK